MNRQAVDILKHFLTIQSVSAQDQYLPEMEKARHFLVDLFHNLGFTTHILKGEKHDAVFAQRITDPKLPTVLIYGHYDVQPPEPLESWETPPFEPHVRDNKIFARGSTDNKGQIMAHIMAVRELVEKYGDNLPINFKFIIEGEEEIGSGSVEILANKHKKNLFRSDYILVSDSEMLNAKQPSIDIGLRGLIYTEVTIEAAKQDLHSGQFGGVAENPAVVLAKIITELKDKNNHVTIPRFYDNVLPSTKQELKEFNSLKTTPKILMKEGQLLGIGGGETAYSLNERRWSRPTLDVNGFTSGYQGEGAKTIIPAKASAKISMRLVPDQDPDEVYKHFVQYLKKLVPKNVKLTVTNLSDALPYKAPTNHPVFDLIKKSLKKVHGKEAVFTGVGGSIGFVPIMAQALKVPCIMVGFGLPDENLHSPNEHFSLENYEKGIETMVDFYQRLPSLS